MWTRLSIDISLTIVLQAAYDKITDAKQKKEEDETAFADRLISAARESCNVFEDRELVNYYIRGLLPSTRDAVKERVRQLPTQEQGDITAVHLVAQALEERCKKYFEESDRS